MTKLNDDTSYYDRELILTKLFLDHLVRNTSESHLFNCDKEEPPNPDFLLEEKSGRKIGLELTEYFPDDLKNKGSNYRKIDSYFELIKKEVQNQLREIYSDKSLLLFIHYTHINNPVFNREDDIETIMNGVDFMIQNKCSIYNNFDMKYLNMITLDKWMGKSNCELITIGDYKSVDEEIIINRIEIKTNKQKKWKNFYDEKWLMIHSGFNNSNLMDITKTPIDLSNHLNKWDKVILFSPSNYPDKTFKIISK